MTLSEVEGSGHPEQRRGVRVWWTALLVTTAVAEGINQFSEARADEAAFTPNYFVRRYFGGFIPWVFRDIPVTRQIDEGLAWLQDALLTYASLV